jgi:hypothetical protein
MQRLADAPLVRDAEHRNDLRDLLRLSDVHAHPVGLGQDVMRLRAAISDGPVVLGLREKQVGQRIPVEMTQLASTGTKLDASEAVGVERYALPEPDLFGDDFGGALAGSHGVFD